MELMAAILFFSLAAAVCIQLFAKAHTLSLDTVNRNNAVTQAQNLAELWLASGENPESVLSFDKDWNLLEDPASPDAAFTAKLVNTSASQDSPAGVSSDTSLNASQDSPADVSPDTARDASAPGALQWASVTISTLSGEELYSLELSKHIPWKRGDLK